METPNLDSHTLHHQGKVKMRDFIREIAPSRWTSWDWCREDFRPIAAWLKKHPNAIRKGSYISHTLGKEVWQFRLPKTFGSKYIVYKFYDFSREDLLKRLGFSAGYFDVANAAFLQGIGIQIPAILACGESRQCGFAKSAYVIMEYIEDTYDGSLLTPAGAFIDKSRIRMGFGLKVMEQFARLHLSGFYYNHFHSHSVLIPKSCDEDNPTLIWTDVVNCKLRSSFYMHKYIPRDLVHFFVELRYDTNQIHTLCDHYLTFNTHTNFSTSSLWKAMLAIKH